LIVPLSPMDGASALLQWLLLSLTFTGDDCLSGVGVRGPEVVESGTQAWVELTCSLVHTREEWKQLDIKWYRDIHEEPFLQWVPSSGRKPQTIGDRNSRIVVKSRSSNTSIAGQQLVEQVVRIERPGIGQSGDYHCKAATFTHEETSTHTLTVFDPGVGPALEYSSLPSIVNLSCSVRQVFPEPRLSLSWYSEPDPSFPSYIDTSHIEDITTTTVRRGLLYDVTVHTLLPTSSLSQQTVFTCAMLIPGTQFSLKAETMFFPTRSLLPRASHIAGGPSLQASSVLAFLILLLLCILTALA